MIEKLASIIEDYWWVLVIVGAVILAGILVYFLYIQWGVYVEPFLRSRAYNATKSIMDYNYTELIERLPDYCNCTCSQ